MPTEVTQPSDREVRVVRTFKAPRQAGAAMAVNESGDIIGSVSGGCVEGEVVAVALDLISKGERRLVRFSYDDESAFSVGLTSGGTIDIFIEQMDW